MIRAAVLMLALGWAAPAAALPAIWTVRDADSELVLFGSIHLLPPGLAWRPAALDAALAGADDLWLEIPSDPASQQEAAALVAPLAYLPAGQTLDAKLSRAGRARLRRAAERLGLPLPQLQAMRPWMAEVMIAGAQAARGGASGAGGVEQALANDPRRPENMMAFETLAQQAQLFSGAPEAEQAVSLEMSLRDIDKDPRGYERLVKAWMSGDLKALDREAVAPLRREAPATFKRLVADRNAAWVETLRARLAGSGRTVVVVGAGHLIGPLGLPARLRALGYEVVGP